MLQNQVYFVKINVSGYSCKLFTWLNYRNILQAWLPGSENIVFFCKPFMI